MLLIQLIELYELLDSSTASGKAVEDYLRAIQENADITVYELKGLKGNRIINHRGFAISPTVLNGYVLKVSDDLLDIMEITTGKYPYVFAVTTQDITPYGNDVYHLNSILQPATAASVPVVGVAITTETAVPSCATGSTHITDLEEIDAFTPEEADYVFLHRRVS